MKAAVELGTWLARPVVGALAALRIAPGAVTGFSLLAAAAAGVSLAFGWFGLGCALATLAALADLVDGLLAQKLGTASGAGQVVDAAVARYVEAFFLAGVIVYYRSEWIVLVLALGALLGTFMVSYTTAKAEAMSVPPPRGAMRRGERAVYLLVGAGLTAITKTVFGHTPSLALRELPIIFALAVVAVVANASSVQRFGAIAEALRAREPVPPVADGDQGGGSLLPKHDTPAGLA